MPVNRDFQELKRQYHLETDADIQEAILNEMRENLLERNCQEPNYCMQYTYQGIVYNINECSLNDLYSIDGDMNPYGR